MNQKYRKLDQAVRHLATKLGYTSTLKSFKDELIKTSTELRMDDYDDQSEKIHLSAEGIDIEELKKCVTLVFEISPVKWPSDMIRYVRYDLWARGQNRKRNSVRRFIWKNSQISCSSASNILQHFLGTQVQVMNVSIPFIYAVSSWNR